VTYAVTTPADTVPVQQRAKAQEVTHVSTASNTPNSYWVRLFARKDLPQPSTELRSYADNQVTFALVEAPSSTSSLREYHLVRAGEREPARFKDRKIATDAIARCGAAGEVVEAWLPPTVDVALFAR